jgi:thiosulfate reductase cytochrome b subunit
MKTEQKKSKTVMKAPKQQPLFRVVHSIHGLVTVLLMVTGLQVYNLLDKELGKIPSLFTLGTWSSNPREWHIALAWLFLLNGIGFLIYTQYDKRRKLFQDKDAERMINPVKNWQVWNFALHHYINTALGSLCFLAGLSGLILMNWMGMGAWANYLGGERFLLSLHLGLAPLFGLLILVHIGLVLKVGGLPLLLSAFYQKSSDEEKPSTLE